MAAAAAQTLQLRPLGNTGLKLSSVGFGASPLGKVFGDVSEQDAIAAVREAFRRGVNFFDTSPFYGGTLSEKVLGRALKALGVPRDQYIVSTKCGRYKEGFDFCAERVTKSIDESLERLQLDYVDIFHCHDIEFGSLDQAACRAAVDHCKERGKNISKLALQYSLTNTDISTILVGMKSVKEVEENIAAALELATVGMDEEALSEITEILKPVKNQTWPSGIQQR